MKYDHLPNPFEDAARGRDPVPMSSGSGMAVKPAVRQEVGADRLTLPEAKRKRGRPRKGEKK